MFNLNHKEKERIMATLESIAESLATIATAVAAIPTTPVAPTVDLTPVLDAIAALSAEIKTNVEGAAPTPAPAA